MMWKKSKYWLLVVLLAASFLRLWKLSEVPVSLFADELDVGYHAYSILNTGRDYSGNFMPLHFQSLAEWRTPLYLYSVVPTVAIWGITPLGVRVPAAVFGILSIWAMYAVVKELLARSQLKEGKIELVALLSAFVMAFSPWHIQYSRAAFEVTMLLMFYLFGLYYFFKAIRTKKYTDVTSRKDDSLEYKNETAYGGQYLFVAVIHLVLTPLIYSTAKLFTPMLMLLLFVIWFKEIISLHKKYIVWAIIAGIIVGAPTAYATLYSGGTQRFGYISIFTDPTRETEVGVKREAAAHFRGETGVGLTPTTTDKLFYNKYTFWGQNMLQNYFEPFSSEFLFIKGDYNLRHSIEGIGQLYKVEAIALFVGAVYFFGFVQNRKLKYFMLFWLLAGVIPSSITREGGRHATRLFITLPVFTFLIAYGIASLKDVFKKPFSNYLVFGYFALFTLNFIFYQKNYWTENPWYSERWWHAGYREAIESVREIDAQYDTVLITDKNEPPWIFFGAYYNYDPIRWQQVKPDANWVDDETYGRVTMIDKFIFASPEGELYDWKVDNKTLFLASEKEVKIDLIKEPERTPSGLKLIKSIPYPSGLPAFYLFTGSESAQ